MNMSNNNDMTFLERLADYWTKEMIIRTVVWALCFIGIAIATINVASAIDKTSTYNSEIARLTDANAQLQANIDELSNHDVPEDLSHSALDTGMDVANLMNKYQPYENSARIDGLAESQAQIEKVNADLIPYFSDISMCYDWYYCPNIYYKWTFETTSSFYGDKCDVIWICRNTNNMQGVIAYATAVYDVTTNKFEDVVVRITGSGTQFIKMNTETTEEPVEEPAIDETTETTEESTESTESTEEPTTSEDPVTTIEESTTEDTQDEDVSSEE